MIPTCRMPGDSFIDRAFLGGSQTTLAARLGSTTRSGLNPANPSGQTPAPVLVPVSIVALNAPGGGQGNGVQIPNAPGQPAPGSPTAVLFNGSTTDFLVAPGKPATFLFATEDGTIQGWNSSVNATTAIINEIRLKSLIKPMALSKTTSWSLAAASIFWRLTCAITQLMYSIPTSTTNTGSRREL